jgi:hypothetical protein
MGNNIAFISWPHGEHNAALMSKFIDIRHSLRIKNSHESPLRPFGPNRCYIAGETSAGISTIYTSHHTLAEQWLRQCRKFVKDNSQYLVFPQEVRLTELHLPM